MQGLIVIVFSYLLGSIPFGFLVAYLIKKIDIRKFGSGNIGATNVFRVVGKKWGILVFILDFLKGFISPSIFKFFFPDSSEYLFVLAAVFCIVGHNWTIFLRFKGGKGVATSLGAMIGLSLIFPNLWLVIVLSLCIWIIIFFIFRYVSLASMIAAFSFFILSLFFSLPKEIKILSFCLFLFIVIRHKKNIKNLILQKEFRF